MSLSYDIPKDEIRAGRFVLDGEIWVKERTCSVTSEEYDDLLDFFTTNFSCGHYGIGMARWFKHCPECGAKVVTE